MTYISYHDISTLFKSIYVNRFQNDILVESRIAKLGASQAIVRALSGDLPPSYYLCGIDCGGGKTTLIKDSLKTWKMCGFRPEGGVIVALNTLNQIEEFVNDCGLSKSDYAVVTGNKRFNSYGCGRNGADSAPVLFTTQQMALILMNVKKSFEKIDAYHFRGRPRRCRIWDESLEHSEAVVIPIDTLHSLPAALRDKASNFVHELDNVIAAIHGVSETGSATVDIPEPLAHLAETVIMNFDRFNLKKDQEEVVRLLGVISGRSATLERGMKGQMALIGTGSPLPADFAPVIIFDASIRLRKTYNLQEKYRNNITRLPSIVHDYRDTTIHLCKVAIGTDKLADPLTRADILSKVANLINGDPENEYLVIHHKEKEGRYDIAGELAALVDDRGQVSYLHWGNHYASNAYRHIRKVIVIGTWRKPDWVYGSLYMASSGEPYEAQASDARRLLRLGEHSHDLMQGVGRSNIRNVIEGRAGKVDVYLFTSPEQGLVDRLQDVFPGCGIVPWEVIESEPKGHLAALIAYLLSAFSAGLLEVKKRDAQEALGISSSQGLRHVTKLDAFGRFSLRWGIVVERYKFTKAASLPGRSHYGEAARPAQ